MWTRHVFHGSLHCDLPRVLPAELFRHAVLLFFAIFPCQGQLEDKNQVAFVWCFGASSQPPRNGRVSGRSSGDPDEVFKSGLATMDLAGRRHCFVIQFLTTSFGVGSAGELCLWQRWVEPPQVCLIPGPAPPLCELLHKQPGAPSPG